jgi:hypothetical protein
MVLKNEKSKGDHYDKRGYFQTGTAERLHGLLRVALHGSVTAWDALKKLPQQQRHTGMKWIYSEIF